MSDPIRLSVENNIAEIVIDHAPVNALDSQGWFLLARTVEAANADAETRVIVLRAEGRGFCAGVDIKELQAHPERIIDVNKGNWETFRAIHQGRAPVIVAAHGFVLGGGIGICGSADMVVLAEDATLGVPEVDRGALGAGAHLGRMLPLQLVRKMYYTGDAITADEAARWGGIADVVPRDALRQTALDLARKVAAKSPTMIALAKESLNGVEAIDLERAYRWEQGFTAQAYLTAESQATRDAFVATGATADFSKKDKA
ncbi:enoyl-CoA hydratase family protein [Thalassorhabdomicrobium marinisediminis]|uniref:Enoyl-CoA hydratase family protein n=1 Tax=Thalassorhabdomicrobium marinisediminis TaxID=2170577 RepID=A0A2T7FU92_9RHOB|nr:enoyl-CoA hydratase family protein [Thalassorhabdomicrobium marinisediminis]PVA05735.1 enoyl-CoA hydratase family protein [Thalassorhabdomicrobium marinisediminis]